MANGTDELGLWKKLWLGFTTALDLVGKVNALDSRLKKQEDEVVQIKLEQANIVGKLEVALLFIESSFATSSASSN